MKIKTPFCLSFAPVTGNRKNVFFDYPVEVSELSEFDSVTSNDHIMGLCEGNRRRESNFEQCDVLFFDIDNSHSENPDDWVAMNDISTDNPGTATY